MATAKPKHKPKSKPKKGQRVKKIKAAQTTKKAAQSTAKAKLTTKQSLNWRSWLKSPLFWLIALTINLNLVLISGVYLLYRQTVLSFKTAPTTIITFKDRAASPTQISIPSVNIDLDVTETNIVDGIWQTSDVSSSFLTSSARPNEGGNIVIYGHNKNQIFGPLKSIKEGHKIILTTADQKQFEYTVQSVEVVKPEEIRVVEPTNFEVLTVYTCTGWLDSQRLVIKALPTKVSSI